MYRRTLIFGIICLLTLATSVLRLSVRIDAAREDRARATAIGPETIRRVEARVAARRSRRFGDQVELVEVRAVDDGVPVPRRLLLRLPSASDGESRRTDALLALGSRNRLALRLSPLRFARNPGSRDREGLFAIRGIGVGATLVDPAWVVEIAERDGRIAPAFDALARVAEGARRRLRARLGERLAAAGDHRGLVRALALGDRGALSETARESFQVLGLSHLLAVSGLHVGLVAGLVAWWAAKAMTARVQPGRDPTRTIVVVSILGAVGYAWLSGATISALRAALGLTVLLGLLALKRSIRPASLLAWLALGILWMEPARAFELGAQLSFAACAGLVFACVLGPSPDPDPDSGSGRVEASRPADPPRRPASERLGQLARSSLRASLAAGFGTAPVLVSAGLPIPLWGPLANLLAIPMTSLFVLPGSLLAAALLSVSGEVRGADPASLISLLVSVAEGLASLLVSAAEAWADLLGWTADHLPSIHAGRGRDLGLVTVASGGGLAGLRLGRDGRASRLMLVVCWSAVVVFGGPSILESRGWATGAPRVFFFDVGQGDAALLQAGGHSVLIDTGRGPPDGSGGQALLGSLRAVGTRSLDLLIVTHGDLDHRGGALRILARLPVAEIWLPSDARRDRDFETLRALAGRRGTRIVWKDSSNGGEVLGGIRLEPLWPPPNQREEHSATRSRNAGSLVLRVEIEGASFLFLGDVDHRVERRLALDSPREIQVDVLKVSHHGSGGGSHRDFLSAVAARHSIISAPCARRRGLPNLGTLDRILDSGSRLWWTGRDGALVVQIAQEGGGGKRLEIHPWASRRNCL